MGGGVGGPRRRRGPLRGEGERGFADGEVVDLIAEGCWNDYGCRALSSDCRLRLCGSCRWWIGGVDGGVAELVVCDAEADGCVLEVEIDHVEIAFEALGRSWMRRTQSSSSLSAWRRRRRARRFRGRRRRRSRGVAAAGEDVEEVTVWRAFSQWVMASERRRLRRRGAGRG